MFDENNIFNIQKVRISYPHLFDTPMFKTGPGKRGGTYLLEPDNPAHKKVIDQIEKKIAELVKTDLKLKKLAADKVCLRDGDESGREEYEGFMTLSSNTDIAPLVLKPNTQDRALDVAESEIYAGCYVDVKLRMWVQNNEYGKRVNTELLTIRFREDGEPLTATHVDEATKLAGFEVDDGLDADDDDLDLDLELEDEAA